jgi:hypothetical protein
MALRFTAAGAPLAVRRIWILQMNQHAWWPITFRMKGSSYLCVFMYPCKWNHASSEKNVNCGSISPSTTDCKNQLQKLTLLAGLRSWEVWITVVLQGLSFSNCVAVLTLGFPTPVSWARSFSDFLGVCSSLAPMSSKFSVSTRRLCFVSYLLKVSLF